MTDTLAPAGPAPLGPAPVPGGPEGLVALASLVGNAAFSQVATGAGAAPARLMRKPRGTMTPEETEAEERRKAEFAGKTFSKPVHEPSIGGRFGISYQPGAGVLTVTVRVLLDFQDFPEELAAKHEWIRALPDSDRVARMLVRGLASDPTRLDEVIAEIAMGRSIVEG